jgi:hypothetical protein
MLERTYEVAGDVMVIPPNIWIDGTADYYIK